MRFLRLTAPNKRRTTALLAPTALMLGLCVLASPRAASACGGLFCSPAAPVLQQAERIVFVDHGDDTVTAIIEIMYSGPAERFAWVLPVAGVPEVSVSSGTALDRLQAATQTSFRTTVAEQVFCEVDDLGAAGDGDGDGDSAGGGDGDGDGDGPAGIGVEARGAAGPYDYVVISVDPGLAQPADAAVNWLSDNGYDVTDLGRGVLSPYLETGMNLIAFRLTKSNDAGFIRPVQLTYTGRPAIPIRPTAVAAAPDMGIMVFVVAAERAVPTNFYAVEPNEVMLNWWSGAGLNYRQVVSDAVDEAGGQAFVTEYASRAPGQLDQRILSGGELTQWQSLSETDDPWNLLEQSALRYGTWDGFSAAVDAAATLPDGVRASDVIGCPRCYDADITLDAAVLRRAIYEQVIRPMVDAQALLATRPYLTRLFTTMSAEEMTEDPVFGQNRDLPEIAAVRTIDYHYDYCRDTSYGDLGQGHRVWVDSIGGPWQLADGMPAALRVQLLGQGGEPVTMVDNYDLIESLLPEALPFGKDDTAGGDGNGDGNGNGDGDAGAEMRASGGSSGVGCSVSSAGGRTPWALLAACLLFGVRRSGRRVAPRRDSSAH